jgi:hypothetical protein
LGHKLLYRMLARLCPMSELVIYYLLLVLNYAYCVVDLMVIVINPTCYILSYYLFVDYVLLNYHILPPAHITLR